MQQHNYFVRGDLAGRKLGRQVGTEVWNRGQTVGKVIAEPSPVAALLLLGTGLLASRFLGRK